MKLRKIIALVLAAMLLCGALIVPASADSDIREKQLKRFEEMKNRKIDVEISHSGGYVMKLTKFYAREAIGVDEDGYFILGPWKCLDSDTNTPMFTHNFQANGTCVAFAYSFDIVWGTDFPFSGVFWNDPWRDVKSVEVRLGGIVRMASCFIKVNDKWVYTCDNCDSHSEWKP